MVYFLKGGALWLYIYTIIHMPDRKVVLENLLISQAKTVAQVYESEDLHGMWIESWLVITKDQKEASVSFSYLSELRKEEILGFERDFTFKERHNVIPKHRRDGCLSLKKIMRK